MGAGASLQQVTKEEICRWDEAKVAKYVAGIGDDFQQYAAIFQQNGVNGERLLQLEDKELEDLGISTSDHRTKLIDERTKLLEDRYNDPDHDGAAYAGVGHDGEGIGKLTDDGRGVELDFIGTGAELTEDEKFLMESGIMSVGNAKEEHHKAATKLQATQRGKQTRTKMASDKSGAISVGNAKEEHHRAATKLQATQRGKQTRKKMQSSEKATGAAVEVTSTSADSPAEEASQTTKEMSPGIVLKTTTYTQGGKKARMVYEVESSKDLNFTIDLTGSTNVQIAGQSDMKKTTAIPADGSAQVAEVVVVTVGKAMSMKIKFGMSMSSSKPVSARPAEQTKEHQSAARIQAQHRGRKVRQGKK